MWTVRIVFNKGVVFSFVFLKKESLGIPNDCPISKGIRNAKEKGHCHAQGGPQVNTVRVRRYTRKNNLHLSGLNLGAHTRATSSLSLSPVAAPRRTPFVPAVGGRRRHRSKHAGPWSPLPSPLHRHCEPCANQAGPVLHFAQPTIARLWEFTVLMLARPAAAAGGGARRRSRPSRSRRPPRCSKVNSRTARAVRPTGPILTPAPLGHSCRATVNLPARSCRSPARRRAAPLRHHLRPRSTPAALWRPATRE